MVCISCIYMAMSCSKRLIVVALVVVVVVVVVATGVGVARGVHHLIE